MIGCIIQARMGSSRLPGKVMMKVDKKNPVIYYVIKQLQCSKNLDDIVIATTNLKQDDVIEDFVNGMGIKCFRGDEKDVLGRYYYCAKKFSFSSIVRIPSDKPLIDPEIVDKLILKFQSNPYDCVTNCLFPTFPQGTEVEIFSFLALQTAWQNATLEYDREHVTSYFYKNQNKFKIFNVEYPKNISHLKWDVNEASDLERVHKIVEKIDKRPILLADILGIIENL
jgi:spore coat polysaccharide biosynthesis protein SpsF